MDLAFFFFLLRVSGPDEVAEFLVLDVQLSIKKSSIYKNIPAKRSTGVRCRFKDVDDIDISSEIGSLKHVSSTPIPRSRVPLTRQTLKSLR